MSKKRKKKKIVNVSEHPRDSNRKKKKQIPKHCEESSSSGIWFFAFCHGGATHMYLPTPPHRQNVVIQGQFFQQTLTGFNSEFSFFKSSCLTKAKEPSLFYYLPIAWGRKVGFLPFPRVLTPCEMQCHWGFELVSLRPFLMTLPITPWHFHRDGFYLPKIGFSWSLSWADRDHHSLSL